MKQGLSTERQVFKRISEPIKQTSTPQHLKGKSFLMPGTSKIKTLHLNLQHPIANTLCHPIRS